MAPQRLLLADDHALFRDGLARLFGYEDDFDVVGEADSTSSAVEATLRLQPDLVLMDLKMPGIGGLGFLLRLRSDPRYGRIPVAIMTGDCLLPHPVQVAAEKLNAQVHFKPIDIDQLYDLTTQLLHTYSH